MSSRRPLRDRGSDLPDMSPHVVVAGVSTRGAAGSAARGGFRVTAIDAFGDLDQHPMVAARTLERTFSARAAARSARDIECDAVAYVSSFENHPRAVATLARGRTLWGNPPSVLRRVRDPLTLASALRERGFAVPAVHFGLEPETLNPEPARLNHERNRHDLAGFHQRGSGDPFLGRDVVQRAQLVVRPPPTGVRTAPGWLVKPLSSGGGRGVRHWSPGTRLPRDCYLQQFVEGIP